jgi:hypothetical protein
VSLSILRGRCFGRLPTSTALIFAQPDAPANSPAVSNNVLTRTRRPTVLDALLGDQGGQCLMSTNSLLDRLASDRHSSDWRPLNWRLASPVPPVDVNQRLYQVSGQAGPEDPTVQFGFWNTAGGPWCKNSCGDCRGGIEANPRAVMHQHLAP